MNKIHAYLLLGGENGLKNEHLQHLKNKAKKEVGSLESHRFYGYEVEDTRVMALLQSPSLFGDVPWIEIAMSESLKKNELKNFINMIKKGVGSGYLIFLSDEERIDKNLESTIPASHKKIFKPLTEEELVEYVRGYLTEKSFVMAEEAIHLLLSRVENDSQTVQRMLDFLIHTVKDHEVKEISIQMVESYIEQSRELTVHDLFFAIAKRNLDEALEVAEKLFYGKEGLNVMTLIVLNRSFKGLVDYKALLSQGYSSVQALKELKIFYQRADSTKIADKNFTQDEVSAILAGALAYDLAARDGNKELVKQVVEQYITSCCCGYFSIY